MKKIKSMSEKEFLSLLLKVLPKATNDPHLADAIYESVAKEVQLRNHVQSFEKFCAEGSVPDLEPKTVSEIKENLALNFGQENVTVVPDEEGKALAVEVTLPESTLTNRVKVSTGEEEEEDVKEPFVPFPVVLPEDPELVWVLGRRESFPPEEAARALASIEEEFWATKAGQKRLREIGERSFAEFVASVPASALGDSNLKRHYKTPEPLRMLRLLPKQDQEKIPATDASLEGAE
jgi:hypothetical protein